MKVCMLTTSYPRRSGDHSGVFLFGLTRELVKAGIQVTVIAPHDATTPDLEDVEGVRVRRFYYFLPPKLQGLCYGSGIADNLRQKPWVAVQIPLLLLGFLLTSWRESRGCDLIHAHWSLAGLAGLATSRLRRIPLVLTMPGAEVFANRGTVLTRFLLNRVDHLIAISTFTLSKILQITKPRSYSVIPYSINWEKFRPAHPDVIRRVREKWSISEGCRVILFVGRLVERKGVQVLIKALADVAGTRPDVRAVIAGSGPMREQLEAQANRLNIASHTAFTGFVPEEELNALYKMATVFVLPSIYDSSGETEGLGVVLLEAMANNIPVVASQVGGITDIITGQQVGKLVEPNNFKQLAQAINDILSDPVLRQTLIENGKQKVHNDFSWKQICSQTIQAYQECTG